MQKVNSQLDAYQKHSIHLLIDLHVGDINRHEQCMIRKKIG